MTQSVFTKTPILHFCKDHPKIA